MPEQASTQDVAPGQALEQRPKASIAPPDADSAEGLRALAARWLSQGRIQEAQLALQAAKEQEQVQAGSAGATSTWSSGLAAGLREESWGTLEAEHERRRQAAVYIGIQRRELERKESQGTLTAAEAQRLHHIRQNQLPKMQQEAAETLTKLQRAIREEAKDGRQNLNLRNTESRLRRAVIELARVEPRAAAVGLQYLVVGDQLYILLVTPGAPVAIRQVSVQPRSLDILIRQTRELVRTPESELRRVQASLKQLHDLLIVPILPDLDLLNARTLMVSLQGNLRYIPFSALHDGKQYLVERHAVAFFNEAVATFAAPPRPAQWQVAGMGLTRAVAGMPALPAVREELSALATVPGMKAQVWIDAQFARTRFFQSLHSGHNVLHVASHFVLDPKAPLASRLYLGDGSTLLLGDVTLQDLRFDNFDLVTFSACDTGVPISEAYQGSELESLSFKVQQQGAQAVLATLWKVYDRSTAQLIRSFYEARGRDQQNKAEALRTAQRGLLTQSETSQYRHPYYWAAFFLTGNWR